MFDRVDVFRRLVARRAATLRGEDGEAASRRAAGTAMALFPALAKEVDEALRGDGPVLCGPWLGEVGYELIYWIPFLRWVVRRRPDVRDRLVVVSRGGVASWYGDIAASYVDVFDLISSDELARLRADDPAGGKRRDNIIGVPQRQVGDADRELLRLAAAKVGATPDRFIHSRLTFAALRALRKNFAQNGVFEGPLVHEAITPPADVRLSTTLPDQFAVVRFYSGQGTPGVDPTTQIATEVVDQLVRWTNVVTFEHETSLDDHDDIGPAARNVVRLSRAELARNLEIQTAVIARANLFVGSYGGLAYLPPLLGVPCAAFVSDPGRINPVHLLYPQRVLTDPRFATFKVIDGQPEHLRRALHALVSAVERSVSAS